MAKTDISKALIFLVFSASGVNGYQYLSMLLREKIRENFLDMMFFFLKT